MMSLWDALRMNMMISYQELVRTFPSDVERLNGECSKKYVSFYSVDFKLIGIFFKPGRSLLNKKGYQEINLLVRIHLSSRSPDLSLERANAIQDGSKSIKKPA
ncbi:hypothetical protein RZG19_003152 [Citrobacter freundii]|nr:hypothetical protein [Citrobacter freundii]